MSHITLISEPIDDNHATAKAYVDSLSESERTRRELFSIMNEQDHDLNDNNLTNIDLATVTRNTTSDNELANKNFLTIIWE